MAKSKGFDVKALLLNHGEKFVAGLIGLLGLTGLATANWSPSGSVPDDLKKVAVATQSAWQANAFTPDKKAAFENTPDVLALAERMQSETEDQERFSTINPWNPSIHLVQERRGAVTVLAPTDPEANAVAIVMAEKPDETEEDPVLLAANAELENKKESDVGEDVKNIFGTGDVVGGGAAGLGIPGQAQLRGGTGGLGGIGGLGGLMGGRRDKDDDEDAQFANGGYGNAAYGGALTASVDRKVRYHSGVSVRMIFPLVEQIRSMAKSLHLPQNDPQVAAAIDFVGFQIQRKRAVPGADPWLGEWESISTDEIGEVLDKSLGFDFDVVNPGVVRSEITMPLPRLAAGQWTLADASHKLLDDFKLDPEEQQLIDRFQAKLLEEAEKRKKLMPVRPEKGGFSRFMLNGSQLTRDVDDTSNLTNQLFGELSQNKKDPKQKSRYDNKAELEKLINKSMAAGRVLLVRFMDFTCDRGNTYIYRVRLEMRNPNFDFPVDQLEQPDLATQVTIFSDWSEQTAPAYVPQSYRYYTQRADNPQSVKVGMYFENEEAGTPVMANIEVRVGSRIGGKQKVEVANLSKMVLEPEDVELKSPDLLAAITPSIRLNSSESPELKAYMDSVRGQGKPLADRITVIDSNGAIVTRYVGDSISNGGRVTTENIDSKWYQDVLKIYEYLKQSANTAINSPYNIDEEDGGMGGGIMRGAMGGGGYGGGMGKGSALSGGGRGAKGGRARDLDR